MMARAVLVAWLVLLMPPTASGYVLERAESGEMVHWDQSCVTWWMESSGCSLLSPEETRDVLRASFETWDEFEGMYVDFEEGGISCVSTAGLDDTGPLNVAMWRHGTGSWPYAARVVGLTTLTFDKETGEIVDADMEFNEEDFAFSHDKQPNTYDLQHAVTHEVGHVLGLGHSTVRQSVMYETAGPEAWNKRRLSLDDEEGVSANHALVDAPELSPCGVATPRGSVEAPVCPEAAPSGCSAQERAPLPLPMLLFVAATLALFVRRRCGHVLRVAAISLVCLTLIPVQQATADTCRPYRIPGGEAIYWTADTVTLAIDPTLPEAIDREAMLRSVQMGAEPWAELPCVTMALEFRDDGDGFSDCPGEVLDDELQCIYWVHPEEDWPFGSGLIAVTLVHHNAITGEIVDTDMALNGTGTFSWSAPEVCDTDTPDHDLIATLTHEFGHFFGLDHSSAPQSVMEAATGPGDCDKRTLEDFDEECLCDTLEETQRWVTPTQDTSTSEPPDVIDNTDDLGPEPEPAPPAQDGCAQGEQRSSGPLVVLSLLWCAYSSRRRQRSRPRPALAR